MIKCRALLPLIITGIFFQQLGTSCSRKSNEKLPQITAPAEAGYTEEDTVITFELMPNTGFPTLNSTEGQIFWKGSYAVGGGHEGTLQLASGSITASVDGKITDGNFIIDMNSIKNTGQRDEKNRKDLEKHLKSDDFFSAAKFPKAYFSIKTVTPLADPNKFNITGDLELKGIVHEVSFPATIHTRKDAVIVEAEISIDRTKWDINYQSESLLGKIKDEAIADKIKISLNLLFNKTT